MFHDQTDSRIKTVVTHLRWLSDHECEAVGNDQERFSHSVAESYQFDANCCRSYKEPCEREIHIGCPKVE